MTTFAMAMTILGCATLAYGIMRLIAFVDRTGRAYDEIAKMK